MDEDLKFIDYVTIAKALISKLDLDSLICDGDECEVEQYVSSSENYDRVYILSMVLRCLSKFRPLPF